MIHSVVDLQKDLIPLLRELGIGIVTYSPLGRGFLTGSIAELADLSSDDRRRWGISVSQSSVRNKVSLLLAGCQALWRYSSQQQLGAKLYVEILFRKP